MLCERGEERAEGGKLRWFEPIHNKELSDANGPEE
jgi:hypothetical protein